MDKSNDALKTIGEAAEHLGVAQHVLRFWEQKFTQLEPIKRRGRRYYDTKNIDLLDTIKHLLYDEGLTIKGVQKYLKKDSKKPNHNVVSEAVIDLSTKKLKNRAVLTVIERLKQSKKMLEEELAKP
jgi:DNA-binding transcriptional MerR regulator